MRKRSLLGLTALVVCVACLLVWVYVEARRGQNAIRASVCQGHLGELWHNLYYYQQTYGKFPPAYVADKNGKPMHSWRILVLETSGDQEAMELYRAYRFDEPWDGPHNRQLLDKMPRFYACPNDNYGKVSKSLANYVVVVGSNAVFHGADSIALPPEPDVHADTIVLAETVPGIPWLEPRDLEFDKMTYRINDPAKPGIASKDLWGAGVAQMDGRIERLHTDADPARIRSMIIVKPNAAQGGAGRWARPNPR